MKKLSTFTLALPLLMLSACDFPVQIPGTSPKPPAATDVYMNPNVTPPKPSKPIKAGN